MKKTILILAALLGAILWTGCQEIEEELIKEKQEKPVDVTSGETVFLSLEASKGVDTKALDLSGNTLNAYWVTGEEVAVYLGGAYKGGLTATVDPSNNTKATLSGQLSYTSGVDAGAELTLLFPRSTWDYTGQDGSAPSADGSLARKYDYATASVTVASISGSVITTTGGADFVNEQSIYRFGFKVNGIGDAIPVKSFIVSSFHDALVRTRSWSGSAWVDTPGSITVEVAGGGTLTQPYASLRNTLVSSSNPDDNNFIDTYYFYVIGSDGALYQGAQGIPNRVMTAQGKFISALNVNITKTMMVNSNFWSEGEVW